MAASHNTSIQMELQIYDIPADSEPFSTVIDFYEHITKHFAKFMQSYGWFGVVDAIFRLLAIQSFRDEQLDVWSAFKWYVLVISNSPMMDRLLYLKRSFEENSRSENIIEMRYTKSVSGYIQAYFTLKGNRTKEPTAVDFASLYDGNEHSSLDMVVLHVRTAIENGNTVIKQCGNNAGGISNAGG